jgi:hypothetical protein
VTWRFRAEDGQRTFELGYTLSGVVRRDADLAEIYFQFVGDQWDRPIGEVEARMHLPGAAERERVRAWAHGPLHGSVAFRDDGSLGFDVAPLPERTFWEARVVAPAEWFAEVPSSGASGRLAGILAEEKGWAETANRRREELRRDAEAAARARAAKRARIPSFLTIASVLGLLGLGVWALLRARHGRPHPVQTMSSGGTPPSAHAPALLHYLMYETVTGPALVATLLDLAHRGHFEVREELVERPRWWGSTQQTDFRFERAPGDADDLAPHERDLVAYLTTRVGDARGFWMSDLKKRAASGASGFQRWFTAWRAGVQEAVAQARLFEPRPVGAMTLNALMGVAILAAGVVMCVLSDSAAGLPAVIGGLLQALLTGTLHRRTPEGQRLLVEWRAFKRHLGSIADALGPVTLDSGMWGRYLAAAIVFGMIDRLLPKLRIAGVERGAGAYPVWFYGAGAGGADDGAGLSTMAESFSSMVQAMSSAMSSAAGAGGGASAGGGGGSGGGGGGAG